MANIYDMADTWNDGAATFAAIKMDVTDTASAAGSLLLDLQVGSTSKFSVDKNGVLTFGDGTNDVELFTRGADADGFGVPVFRAATTDTVTALDVFPNGSAEEGTGKAWIHVLGQDLSQDPTPLLSRWQANLLATRSAGMTVGADRGSYNVTVTGGSGTGTTVTLTFEEQIEAPFAVGSEIEVTGVTPTQMNGNHIVTDCTTTSVSYSNTQTTYTSGGTIQLSILPLAVSGRIITLRSTPSGQAGTDYLAVQSGSAYFGGANSPHVWLNSGDTRMKSNYAIKWQNGATNAYGSTDLTLKRAAANILNVSATGAGTAGAAIEVTEMTAPVAGGATSARLFAEDDGAGKTRLMVQFGTGAAQQIAIEP